MTNTSDIFQKSIGKISHNQFLNMADQMIQTSLSPSTNQENVKVAIVGFSRSSRSLAPYDDPSYDIWGMNEGYNGGFMKRITAWFQLHPRWDFTRKENSNDPNHWDWLQQPHEYPIFMQERYADIPSSVQYPIEQVIEKFDRYFTSTAGYMMALAGLFGYKRIELYGVDMNNNTEYALQKPAGEYIIGFLRGMGIEVVPHKSSPLLKAPLYGYDDIRIGFRQHLEMRTAQLINEEEYTQAILNKTRGYLDALEDATKQLDEAPITWEYLKDKTTVMKHELDKQVGIWNAVKGAQAENNRTTSSFDQYNSGVKHETQNK